MRDAVGFGTWYNGYKRTNVLNHYILLNQDYSRRKSKHQTVSAKLKPKWTEVFSCNLIKQREKEEEKEGRGEEGTERCTPNY